MRALVSGYFYSYFNILKSQLTCSKTSVFEDEKWQNSKHYKKQGKHKIMVEI